MPGGPGRMRAHMIHPLHCGMLVACGMREAPAAAARATRREAAQPRPHPPAAPTSRALIIARASTGEGCCCGGCMGCSGAPRPGAGSGAREAAGTPPLLPPLPGPPPPTGSGDLFVAMRPARAASGRAAAPGGAKLAISSLLSAPGREDRDPGRGQSHMGTFERSETAGCGTGQVGGRDAGARDLAARRFAATAAALDSKEQLVPLSPHQPCIHMRLQRGGDAAGRRRQGAAHPPQHESGARLCGSGSSTCKCVRSAPASFFLSSPITTQPNSTPNRSRCAAAGVRWQHGRRLGLHASLPKR